MLVCCWMVRCTVYSGSVAGDGCESGARRRRGSCRYPGAGTRRDYPRSRVTSVPTCRRGLGSPGSLRQMSLPQLPLFLYPDSPQMLPVAVRAARGSTADDGVRYPLTLSHTPLFTLSVCLSVRLGKQSSRWENKNCCSRISTGRTRWST